MNPLQAAQFLLLTTQLQLQQRLIGLIELELQVLELQVEIDELERPTPRKWWVKNWIRQRHEKEPHLSLFRDLQVEEDLSDFRSYIRMDIETFRLIVRRVGPRIQKKYITFRQPISVIDRLLVTISYLAEGGTYRRKKFLSRTPQNTMSKI